MRRKLDRCVAMAIAAIVKVTIGSVAIIATYVAISALYVLIGFVRLAPLDLEERTARAS